MNDLKPWGWVRDGAPLAMDRQGPDMESINYKRCQPLGFTVPLYAIPDTHRVVSVEALEWIADSCANTDAETALRTIIDNKEQKE